MITTWKDPKVIEPPLGKPLVVTIKRDWQSETETIGCVVYYLIDPRTGKRQFYEAADLNGGLIGPEQVTVIAWDFWPDAYQKGDAYDGS